MNTKSAPVPEFYNDLKASLAHAWAQMARGAADRRSPFHTPVLATIGLDGAPKVRTVVLRAFEHENRTLRVHSDVRTEKYREIERNPAVAFHFYDPGLKLQLRVGGVAAAHAGDTVSTAAWRASQAMSRACYGQIQAPGAQLDDPTELVAPGAVPDGELTGYQNFGTLLVSISEIDWLYLGHRGHRRARFHWTGDTLHSTWLAP